VTQSKLVGHKQELSPKQRIKAFKSIFPKYPSPFEFNGAIYGIWIIGALYSRSSGFYGAYPHKVLERLQALFPDCEKIGHLFSGTIQEPNTLRFDISEEFNPTICDDVRNLKKYKKEFGKLDILYADPPYDKADFEKYGQPPFNKNQVIRDLGEIMNHGSYLCWLDTRIPMYNKETWQFYGHIALIVSTNTRVRCWSIWRHS